jgi:hypothetical protein
MQTARQASRTSSTTLQRETSGCFNFSSDGALAASASYTEHLRDQQLFTFGTMGQQYRVERWGRPNEDLWGEIPRQTPHVDEAQEQGQAQRVVRGHPTVDLRLIKRMASQFTITLEYLKLMTGMQQKAFTKIPQRM